MKPIFTLFPASLLRAGLFTALVFLLNGGQVFADTYTFTGSGNWDTSARWSPSYPGASIGTGHTIIIDGTCTQNVAVTTSSPITINAGGTLTVSGGNLTMSINLTNNGSLTVNSGRTLTINSGRTFTHNGNSASISGILNNNGTVTVNADKTLTINSGGRFANNNISSISGTLTIDGEISCSFGKTLTINSGGIFNHNNSFTNSSNKFYGTLLNDGTFNLNGYFTTENLSNNNILNSNAGSNLRIYGTFTHDGTSTSISGTLINQGTVTVNPGKTLTIGSSGTVLVFSGKTLTIQSGGTFTYDGTSATIYSNGTLINDGTVTVNPGKTLTVNGTFTNNNTFNHNGNLNGTGTIDGTASFSNPSGGTVAPGTSPGCLTFGNGLTNDGNLEIEVNGTTACTQFDRITVTGTATLGGTLDVSIGYTPTNGDVITFLDATSISGTFSTVSAPSGWSLAYDSPSAGKVSLQYALLPVELVSFQASTQDKKTTLLTWRTASELNNQGFDIERSSDGRTWQTLGFVPGHGTTQEEQSYTFTDERPLPGINYYRLRQMDFDGKMEYSDIRSVVMDGSANGLQVYPNPVSDGLLNVNFAAELEGDATLRIFDASGRMLYREVLANQHNQTNYGHLPAGIYFIEVTSGHEVWRERLVVQ